MKVIKSKEDWITAAEEIIADLNRVFSWGRMWNINFESTTCHSPCVSLKRYVECDLPLFMDSLSIEDVDKLKILGFYFDRRLTWSSMIENKSTLC